MKNVKQIAIFLIVACMTLSANAQQYYFKHYKNENGLPNNTVFGCLQDKKGFMWFGTKDGLCRFDGYNFKPFFADPESESSLPGGMIMKLCEDQDGLLWIATTKGICYYNPENDSITRIKTGQDIPSLFIDIEVDQSGNLWFVSVAGLYVYDKKNDTFTKYLASDYFSPTSICIVPSGQLWFTSLDGNIYAYNSKNDNFDQFNILTDSEKANGISLNYVEYAGADNQLLISTDRGGMKRFEINNGTLFTLFTTDNNGERIVIQSVMAHSYGEYWIGSENGIYIYTTENGLSEPLRHVVDDPYSLSSDGIRCLTTDKDGGIWVGTFYGGINYLDNGALGFNKYYQTSKPESIKGAIIRSICPDDNGNLWIGTEDEGVNFLNIQTGNFIHLSEKDGMTSTNVQSLLLDGNRLWVGSYDKGIYIVDTQTRRVVEHYYYDPSGAHDSGLTNNLIARLFKDHDGTIWVGTTGGIYTWNPYRKQFTYLDNIASGCFVHTFFEDSKGILWIGTYGSGLFCLDRENIISKHFSASLSNYHINSDYITSFFEDRQHRIWITSEGGGMCHTDVDTKRLEYKFINITRKDGLPSNITCAIAEDRDGMLWISTTSGLMEFDPELNAVKNIFTEKDGLTDNHFAYGACYTDPNGLIYMGTINGMNSFNPAEFNIRTKDLPIYIVDITASNFSESFSLTEPGKSTMNSNTIRVKYGDAPFLRISFSAHNYTNPSAVYYEYYLNKKGETSITTSNNSVTYTDLRPGRYTFEVKIAGSASPLSRKSLTIKIIPPFYQSLTAKIIYLFIILGIAFYVLTMYVRKKKNERARQLEQFEQQKQNEIYNAKINFFTNITHEIRTPLTLIKMPLDKIVARDNYPQNMKDDLLIMQANADRLLSLTNQLLDLRKMEREHMRLNFTSVDMCRLIDQSCKYFVKAADEQNVRLTVHRPDSPLNAVCNSETVMKIMSNLLSNAMKYCRDEVDVYLGLSEDGQNVMIRVNSNGEHIDGDYIEKIFEPFYQIDNKMQNTKNAKGTGLGLPLARALTNLHNGRLYYDTEIEDKNSFVLELPVNQPDQIELQKTESPVATAGSMEQTAEISFSKDRNVILVVEDEAEMRNYIAHELSKNYNVVMAANGQEALQIMTDNKVDLVISDIMMPVMDGCELCNKIKNSVEFSHIPVVLLTAAVGLNTRMNTLELGADGYIEKPFSMELLLATIQNLFKNRQIAYDQFVNSPLAHFKSLTVSNVDHDYIARLHSIIMQHIAEPDLNLDTVAEFMGTSKSTLYRKIKANTGLNTNEYIRLARLKKAAEMLTTNSFRINEVAYLVGFSSPSYFTTSFQKQFNISPSDFLRQQRNKPNEEKEQDDRQTE